MGSLWEGTRQRDYFDVSHRGDSSQVKLYIELQMRPRCRCQARGGAGHARPGVTKRSEARDIEDFSGLRAPPV